MYFHRFLRICPVRRKNIVKRLVETHGEPQYVAGQNQLIFVDKGFILLAET